MTAWKKYEGQEVVFEYSNLIYFSDTYCWLNAFSKRLEEIRTELGLRVVPEHPALYPPRRPGWWTFHSTLGNFKGLPSPYSVALYL
jgi:hypothetical protein